MPHEAIVNGVILQLRSRKADLRPGRADSKPERADLRPGKAAD